MSNKIYRTQCILFNSGIKCNIDGIGRLPSDNRQSTNYQLKDSQESIIQVLMFNCQIVDSWLTVNKQNVFSPPVERQSKGSHHSMRQMTLSRQ